MNKVQIKGLKHVNLLCGAEFFFRNYSNNSPHFMESEVSLLLSKEPTSGPCLVKVMSLCMP